MAVELDDDVEGLARLSYAIAFAVQVGYLLVWVSVSLYVVLDFGFLAGLATLSGIYLAGSLPVLAITADSEFVTDEEPGTAREELARLDAPAMTYLVVWADEIDEQTDGDVHHYELYQSSLGLFDREITVSVEDSDETGIAFQFGDDRNATVRILVHGEDGETTVRVRSTADRSRPRHVLTILLQSAVERRIWKRLGYRPVSGSLDVGI